MKCNKCDKTITMIPFTCNCCGKTFCVDCRHPETHICKPDKRSVYGILGSKMPTPHQPYCIDDVMTVAPELYGDFNDCECEEMLEAELIGVNELADNIGQ